MRSGRLEPTTFDFSMDEMRLLVHRGRLQEVWHSEYNYSKSAEPYRSTHTVHRLTARGLGEQGSLR